MAILDMLTPEQRTAVTDHGGALLVAAAAGSGKTFVLVQRLMERVCDPEANCNIDDFLIITYTNAAAAELRDKIMEEITARMAASPNDRRLRRQEILCHRAHIGTIHSFCNTVLRENAAKAGIAPDFRVADDNETSILKQKAIDDLLDDCYTDMTEDFAGLLDMMSTGESDAPLAELILSSYNSLQSHPYPDDWCDKNAQALDLSAITDISQTPWGQELMNHARSRAKYYMGRLQQALDDFAGDEKFNKSYAPHFLVCLNDLRQLCAAMDIGWDESVKCADISLSKVGPLPNTSDYQEAKSVKDIVKDGVKEFRKIFSAPSQALIKEMEFAAPAIRELLNLVKRFSSLYAEAKRRRGIIDFNDEEHLALNVLIDHDTGLPTDIARDIAPRFTEIMVDEYQDVNRVQEQIISAVSKEGRNLFMVGDVKQSIYRFRLADPTIFIEKYNSYPMAGTAADGEPRKVILSRNFRSRAGVLEAANYVFSNIMSTELGELEYTPAEYLYPGAVYPDYNEPCAELAILCVDKDSENDNPEYGKPTKSMMEADWVARRIFSLKDTMKITDGDSLRTARWSDFAILLRSTATQGRIYAAALEARGIPVISEVDEEFFAQPEIAFMMSLLTVIDNPRQDIPLISVLRSPVYGFTPDELADIRMKGGRDFYESLTLAAEDSEKCAGFIKQLNQFRSAAPELTADRLVWHIYNVTDLTGIYGAMRQGEDRRRNLMQFFENAREYEQNGFKGLFQFITAMREKMNSARDSVKGYSYSGEDAVRIMSIHKSKGLEFPVVFMADLGHRFNEKDLTKNMLLHRELGPGAKIIDTSRRVRFSTLAHRAVARRIKNESLSEELRVLYVGMTRAKEKLIMTASFASQNYLSGKSLCRIDNLPADPESLKTAGSMASWIVPVILGGYGENAIRRFTPENLWTITFDSLTSESFVKDASIMTDEPSSASADEALTTLVKERISFRYPYTESIDLPSKLAPTELKGRAMDEEAREDAGEAPKLVGKHQRGSGEVRRPNFVGEAPLSAAGKGTALHAVMQYADWKICTDIDAVKAEIHRLVTEGRITSNQAETVDPNVLLRFFTSYECKMAIASGELRKEFKFSALLPASDFFDAAADDKVLVQGVVDCWFEQAGKLVIIDFKTDRVEKENALERAHAYSGQLDAYAAAMESITGKRVSQKILYFTTPGVAVYL